MLMRSKCKLASVPKRESLKADSPLSVSRHGFDILSEYSIEFREDYGRILLLLANLYLISTYREKLIGWTEAGLHARRNYHSVINPTKIRMSCFKVRGYGKGVLVG